MCEKRSNQNKIKDTLALSCSIASFNSAGVPCIATRHSRTHLLCTPCFNAAIWLSR